VVSRPSKGTKTAVYWVVNEVFGNKRNAENTHKRIFSRWYLSIM
jgi:hypothetical protein